jgi:hypothetical protein
MRLQWYLNVNYLLVYVADTSSEDFLGDDLIVDSNIAHDLAAHTA